MRSLYCFPSQSQPMINAVANQITRIKVNMAMRIGSVISSKTNSPFRHGLILNRCKFNIIRNYASQRTKGELCSKHLCVHF